MDPARTICARYLVFEECAAFVADEAGPVHGVWAGQSQRQRDVADAPSRSCQSSVSPQLTEKRREAMRNTEGQYPQVRGRFRREPQVSESCLIRLGDRRSWVRIPPARRSEGVPRGAPSVRREGFGFGRSRANAR